MASAVGSNAFTPNRCEFDQLRVLTKGDPNFTPS